MGYATTARMASTGSVKGTKGTVWAVHVEPSGTAGTIVIKDGGASGTTMLSLATPASATSRYSLAFSRGLACDTSIYVEVSNAVAVVHYS